MTTYPAIDQLETLADLLHHLGDVPPFRVRLHPTPGTATIHDVAALDAHTDMLYELIDGVLVQKGMDFRESILNAAICSALYRWVHDRDLGLVSGAGGTIQISPNQLRIPDAAFVSWRRWPGGDILKEPAPLLAPDLIVETLNPTNTPAEMARKRLEYFAAGVRLIWEIDITAKSAAVYEELDSVTVLAENAVLDGGEVLPGFELSLKKLFAEWAGPK